MPFTILKNSFTTENTKEHEETISNIYNITLDGYQASLVLRSKSEEGIDCQVK